MRTGKEVLILGCFLTSAFMLPAAAHSELYIAGQLGGAFPGKLDNAKGTGSRSGDTFSSFDLTNSFVIGGKIGYFLDSHPWLGVDLDGYTTTPKIKQQTIQRTFTSGGVTFTQNINQKEAELRVTTVALNLMLRYPGETWQPYVGGGPGFFRTTGKDFFTDTSTGVGFNFVAGLRVFVIKHLAVFGEFKYFGAKFKFDNAFGPGAGIEEDYKASQIVAGVSYHF
jgi:opacity protein-like surface antigen